MPFCLHKRAWPGGRGFGLTTLKELAPGLLYYAAYSGIVEMAGQTGPVDKELEPYYHK